MAVELASGYISLGVAMDDKATQQLGKVFSTLQGKASQSGKAMGDAIGAGVAGGASRSEAELARLQRVMDATASKAKQAGSAQEAAARKVAIEEAKLAELKQKGVNSGSRLLAAEDRVASARKRAADAALQEAAAVQRASDAAAEYEDQAKRAARLNTSVLKDALRVARGEASPAEASRIGGRFGAAMGNGIRGAAGRVNPFSRLTAEASRSGEAAGSRFGASFAGRVRQSVGKLDVRSMMAGGVGGLAAGVGSSIIGSITGGLGGAAAQVDSDQTFAKSLEFAKVSRAQIGQLSAQTQDYANKTVYDLAEIRKTTASFAASGVAGAQQFTEALGNLNAVGGGTSETFGSMAQASTQIMGAGKLTAENWAQLRDAVPGAAAVIQKELQKSGAFTGNFTDAMAKGQITAEEYQKAIQNVGMTKVAKDAAQNATTFAGAWGNMKATIEGGLAKSLKAVQPLVAGAMNAMGPVLERGFGLLARGVTGAVTVLGRVKPVLDRLSVSFAGSGRATGLLMSATQSLTVYWRQALRVAGEFAAGMMVRIRPMLPAVRQVFAQIGVAVAAGMRAVRDIVVAVSNVVGYVWRRWGHAIMDFAANVFSSVVRFAGGFFRALTGVFRLISAVLTGNWSGAWRAMRQILSGAWQMIKATVSLMWTTIKALFNAGGAAVGRAFGLMWSGVRHAASSAWGSIRDSVFAPMGRFLTSTIPGQLDRFTRFFGDSWAKIKHLASAPVKAVVDTVWNNGIVSLADKAGLGDVFHRVEFKGFRVGGYTGNKKPWEVAGLVHGQEFVMDAETTARAGGAAGMERVRQSIQSGNWPVGAAGEVAGDSQQQPHPLTSYVGAGVPMSMWDLIRRGPQRGDTGLGGAAENGLAHLGEMGWYRKCLAFVNAAWGHSIPRLMMATARLSMNAGPLAQGVPPRGAAAYYNTRGPAGHVALSMGDGSVLSNDIVAPGRIDRVPYNIFASSWGAPYMGYFMPGGGGPGLMSKAWASIKGAASSAWDMVSGEFGKLQRFVPVGTAPWSDVASNLAKAVLGKAKSSFMNATGLAVDPGGSGVQRWAGVAKQAMAAAGLPEQYLPLLLHRMQVESGGDPNAQNNWDVNARNGVPSQGLMQVIPPTFSAYAGQYAGRGIRDPFANIYAAIKYTLSRYGLNGIQRAWGGRLGYDNGGWLQPMGGMQTVFNHSGKPEPVFTSTQWDSIHTLASVGASQIEHAPGRDQSLRIVQGELSIDERGKAFIRATALEAQDDRRRFDRGFVRR